MAQRLQRPFRVHLPLPALAKPDVYEALEERGVRYAIRIPANDSLERDIAGLLTRPPEGSGTERWPGTLCAEACRRILALGRETKRGIPI